MMIALTRLATRASFTPRALGVLGETRAFHSHAETHSHTSKIVQNRAKRGLFAGKHIRFGNSVSHSHRKTRRTWLPNIQNKKYFSELLQKSFELEVTTHAMRCIDKAGGFDAYLLNTPLAKLGGKDTVAAKIREQLETVYRPIRNRLAMEARLAKKGLAVHVHDTQPPANATNTASNQQSAQ